MRDCGASDCETGRGMRCGECSVVVVEWGGLSEWW
jgi:hypothetical protein